MALYQHRYLGHTAAGENWMFTWWAESARSSASAAAAAVTWAQTLWAGAVAGDGLEDHLPTTVGLDSVSTVEIDTATGTQISRLDTAVSLDGVNVANTLPSDCTAVVSLRTATPTRSGRGRFYLPPGVVADVAADGRIVPDFIADVGASLAAAWTGYNSASDRPVIYSRKQRVTRSITSFDLGDLWDTQRGREGNLVEARTSTVMP